MDGLALLDLREILDTCGGDRLFVDEVLVEYVAQAPEITERMSEAISSGDVAGVKDAAHGLKGCSRTIGAFRVGQWSEIIEEQAKTGDLARAAESLGYLREELASVLSAIQDRVVAAAA